MKAIALLFLSPLLIAQTAVFPGAVASTQNLPLASNRVGTTLAIAMGPTDSSITVASAAGVATPTVLTIDDERIHVCSLSGNTFSVCASGRAFDSSIAAPHAALAKVEARIGAQGWNQIIAEIIATETQVASNTTAIAARALASDLATTNTTVAANTAAIATKADATATTNALATKADATATTSALATKVGIGGDLGGTATSPTVTKIQGQNVSSAAPSDGQVRVFSSTSNAWLPVTLAQQMDSRPLKTFALKPPNDAAAIVAAGGTTTIASLTGPGTMEGLSFASISGTTSASAISPATCSSESTSEGGGVDSQFTLVVDGTTVFDHVPAGILFNFYGYNSNGIPTATRFYQINLRSVDHYTAHADFGASRKMPVHFTTSLSLTWTNTSPCGQLVFSGVDYRTGTPPVGLYNPRMNKMHATYVGFTSVSGTVGTAFTPLPTVTPGSAGLLYSIDIFVLQNSASQPTWLEGHPLVTVDGSPGVTQKGTEDFFGSHFYFFNGLRNGDFGQGFVGPGPSTDGTYYTGIYRYFVNQPCFFNTSLAFSMENGHVNEGATTSILYAALIFWYTVS